MYLIRLYKTPVPRYWGFAIWLQVSLLQIIPELLVFLPIDLKESDPG
jgi:hypothetical protein